MKQAGVLQDCSRRGIIALLLGTQESRRRKLSHGLEVTQGQTPGEDAAGRGGWDGAGRITVSVDHSRVDCAAPRKVAGRRLSRSPRSSRRHSCRSKTSPLMSNLLPRQPPPPSQSAAPAAPAGRLLRPEMALSQVTGGRVPRRTPSKQTCLPPMTSPPSPPLASPFPYAFPETETAADPPASTATPEPAFCHRWILAHPDFPPDPVTETQRRNRGRREPFTVTRC